MIMDATRSEVSKIMSKPTCSVEDAAKVLGIGRGPAYRAVNAGEIRAVRIGGRLLVSTSALRDLLDGVPAA
jgi:excisionase family DNA binding protein